MFQATDEQLKVAKQGKEKSVVLTWQVVFVSFSFTLKRTHSQSLRPCWLIMFPLTRLVRAPKTGRSAFSGVFLICTLLIWHESEVLLLRETFQCTFLSKLTFGHLALPFYPEQFSPPLPGCPKRASSELPLLKAKPGENGFNKASGGFS